MAVMEWWDPSQNVGKLQASHCLITELSVPLRHKGRASCALLIHLLLQTGEESPDWLFDLGQKQIASSTYWWATPLGSNPIGGKMSPKLVKPKSLLI